VKIDPCKVRDRLIKVYKMTPDQADAFMRRQGITGLVWADS
jgi:hypothetical protein